MPRGSVCSTVATLVFLCVVFTRLWCVAGRARLIEPTMRSSVWRLGDYNVPMNYLDELLNCGGFYEQWQSAQGRCGACGDAFNSRVRQNEFPGIYTQQPVMASIYVGQKLNVTIYTRPNMLGFFEFRLCPRRELAIAGDLDRCFGANPPLIIDETNSTRYYAGSGREYYDMHLRMPEGVVCDYCVLQWKYHTGYRMGRDYANCGECLGCGPQEEFINCADISIKRHPSDIIHQNIPHIPIGGYIDNGYDNGNGKGDINGNGNGNGNGSDNGNSNGNGSDNGNGVINGNGNGSDNGNGNSNANNQVVILPPNNVNIPSRPPPRGIIYTYPTAGLPYPKPYVQPFVYSPMLESSKSSVTISSTASSSSTTLFPYVKNSTMTLTTKNSTILTTKTPTSQRTTPTASTMSAVTTTTTTSSSSTTTTTPTATTTTTTARPPTTTKTSTITTTTTPTTTTTSTTTSTTTTTTTTPKKAPLTTKTTSTTQITTTLQPSTTRTPCTSLYSNTVCRPSPSQKNVKGMFAWCNRHCRAGSCPDRYCHCFCRYPDGYEAPVQQVSMLSGVKSTQICYVPTFEWRGAIGMMSWCQNNCPGPTCQPQICVQSQC